MGLDVGQNHAQAPRPYSSKLEYDIGNVEKKEGYLLWAPFLFSSDSLSLVHVLKDDTRALEEVRHSAT